MKLKNPGAQLYVPDGVSLKEALARTTHMGIGAHPDDLEILGYHGILQCFQSEEEWFFGVVVTDGSASPRDLDYAQYTDEDMRRVRAKEQKKAAVVGEYSGLAMLDYTSPATKDPANEDVVEDLRALLEAAQPQMLYTHNLADKHDTHIAAALKAVRAVRLLPTQAKPKKMYGCEVWRDLDWLVNDDKVALEVSAHENLATALVGIFDSQVCGGKRYDLATMGRRRANATYHATHGTDITTGLIFAMDMTPLVEDPSLDLFEFVSSYIKRFADDVGARIKKLSS